MRKSLSHAGAKLWILAFSLCILFLACPLTAYADTDGTELQITDQPATLNLQLGQAWAGVEFELKTDAGLYPQPITVSDAGVLTMELGGSKTYVLSVLNSSVPAPDPDPTTASHQAPESAASEAQSPLSAEKDQNVTPDESTNDAEENNLIRGIPNLHLFLFAGGLVVCIAALVIMYISKRRQYQYEDDEDEDEDNYDD